jgi:hypothetical protein
VPIGPFLIGSSRFSRLSGSRLTSSARAVVRQPFGS